MSGGAHVRYRLNGPVAEIGLSRPPLNAFSLALLDEILAALDAARADRTVRAVILYSELERIFCAGLDLDIILSSDPATVRAFLERLYLGLFDAQAALGKPSIAAVDGAARGGGMTLAISCDMIIAGTRATFGYPEINLALPPAIHFAHLHRIVGRHRAFDLLFTGRSITAEEALQLGLASRLAPSALEEARAAAQTLAEKSPHAIAMSRAAFRREADGGYRDAIACAVDDFCAAAASPHAREGLKAFLDKRKPDWPC